MTLTLIKHEWLRTRGLLTTLTGIVALLVLMGALLALPGWTLVSVLGAHLVLMSLFALVVGVQIGLVVDYWRSSYGRIGYFTQTLPIRGPVIYRAKLTWAWLVTLAAVAVAFLLAVAAWPAIAHGLGVPEKNPFAVLGQVWTGLTAVAATWQVLVGAVAVLVMVLIWPVLYYFAASVGSEARFNRLGIAGPVLVWVGLYLTLQVLTMIALFAIPLGIGQVGDSLGIVPFDVWGEFSSGAASEDVLPLGAFVPPLLVAAYCLWRTTRSWDRRVSLA